MQERTSAESSFGVHRSLGDLLHEEREWRKSEEHRRAERSTRTADSERHDVG